MSKHHSVLFCALLNILLLNVHLFADNCGKITRFEQFCEEADFVGLVVFTDTFHPFENAKFFCVIDSIKGSDSIILVMDSYGHDERDDLSCEIGDTILLAAKKHVKEILVNLTLLCVIEKPPLYYVPACTESYLKYSKGNCSYVFKPEKGKVEYWKLKNNLKLK